MLQKLLNRALPAVSFAVPLSLVAGSANAAIDVTAITTLITDGVTAVAAIGVGFGLFWGTRKIYSKLFGA